jgi:dTDP-4-amino-4,6-dideoxygalactose transaminase
MNRIPISKPYFGAEEMEAIQKPLETGWVVQGPYAKNFEDAFYAHTKPEFYVASASCTSTLHLSVTALDLYPGQEVIVPAFTSVSTTTQDIQSDTLVRSLRDHGASRSDLAGHTSKKAFLLPEYRHLGCNCRMTDIQGALGEVQMSRFPWILEERPKQARFYDESLADVFWISSPQIPEGYEHGYQAYVCHFQPEEPTYEKVLALGEARNKLMSALEGEGIATRQGTHAPVTQIYYKDKYSLNLDHFPQSVLAEQVSLALPLFPSLTQSEQQRDVDTLVKFGPQ